jgi:hypothetical protein
MSTSNGRVDANESDPIHRSGRLLAFRILSGLFAAGSLGGLIGIGLVIGWFDTEEGGIHRVHDIGFGVLYGIILTGAFIALAWRPERNTSAFYQVVVTAAAALLSAAVSMDGSYLFFGVTVIVAAAILLALHPTRRDLLRPTAHPSPVLALLAAAGAVPLVGFALTAARLQRTGLPADPHVSMDHWANMAAMAFGIVLAGFLASARFERWRFTAWCAGLGAAVYGLASLVFDRFPGTSVPYPGSEGAGWGIVAMVGGAVFMGAAEWQARQAG